MDLSAFYTQHVTSDFSAASPVQAGANQSAALAASGLSFIDLFLARLAETDGSGPLSVSLTEGQNGEAALEAVDSEGELVLATSDQTEIQDFFSLLAAPVDEAEVTAPVRDGELTESAKRKLQKLLDHFLNGVPTDHGVAADSDNSGTVTKNNQASLIATGLSPEEMAVMQKHLQDMKKDDEILAGVITISIPQEQVAITAQTAINPNNSDASVISFAARKQGGGDIASQLNALVVGESNEESLGDKPYDFKDVLKIIEKVQNFDRAGIQNVGHAVNDSAAKTVSPTAALPAHVMQAIGGMTSNNFGSDLNIDAMIAESLNSLAPGGQGINSSSLAQLANLSNQAQSSASTHPATQMVAVQINRAASTGFNNNMTIRLDPPALGRVQINMEFDQSKNGVKAVVIAEKPETFMMLQRDSHALERALQEAGLETDSGSLSFELSQDGNLFDHDDRRQGNGSEERQAGHTGTDDDSEDITDIIEQSMNWKVDPNTGRMHYNVLV